MEKIRRIAFIGNYLPRLCGIATFTTDLVQSVQKSNPNIECFTVAMNDRNEGYKYPSEVKFEINQNIFSDYNLAAEYLNFQQVDLVYLQPEYNIFDGKIIFPQLLETSDFISFRFLTLNGEAAKNKGMALFPRKINGLYTMLSRQDNENLFVVFSDNLHFWFDPIKIIRPRFTWEFIQIGNCGSPIEIEEGWLVLSHGVGPMRKYCIGAFLLDKKNPSKVIGRLKNPIIEPKKNNKQGYVPNVVYTCGGLVHNNKLILPYSMFDYSTTFAIIDIKDILDEMV